MLKKRHFHQLLFLGKNIAKYSFLCLKHSRSKIRQFRNIHANKTIICVGAGPSLNKEDLFLLNNQIVIFTNSSYKIRQQICPAFSYWIAQDTYRMREMQDVRCKKYGFSATFKSFHDINSLSLSSIHSDDIILLPRIAWERLFNPSNPILSFLTPLYFPKAICNLPKFSEKIDELIELTGSSVIFSAIQIAAYMGASRIGLLGVDMNYTTDLKSSYFDFDPNRVNFGPYMTGNYYNEVRRPIFIYFRQHLLNKGVSLINCTCSTSEDVLDKDSLSNFLQKDSTVNYIN